MHNLAALSAALVASAITAQAAPADPPASPPAAAGAEAPSEISRPIWVRTPSGEDYADDYPRDAIGRVPLARVVMMCAVSHDGHLDPCKITFETPTGFGFGDAALKIATRFQMKTVDRDGVPTPGRTIVIPIRMQGPGS
jgi:periplasmic protein TonB